jgi:serine/threonine-protein kinase RsbW
MTGSGDFVLETTASPASLDEVHALFARLWAEAGDVKPPDRIAFETAVAEVAANIVEHAARGEAVAMRLLLRAPDDRVEAHLEDLGYPYDAGAGPAPAPTEDGELPEHGRGLVIARALTDELVYERDGGVNRWFLLRRRHD